MRILPVFIVSLLLASSTLSRAAMPPEQVLIERPMTEAIKELSAQAQANPADQNARFALGIAQVVRAAERMAGAFYEHGLRANEMAGALPMFRMPVPPNLNPKPTSIADVDRIMQDFVNDLAEARKTLEPLNDPNVKLPLKVGLLRLDLNGDAPGGEGEAWTLLLGDFRGQNRAMRDQSAEFVIGLDLADVHWLRGYCHLLSAIAEMALAHDKQALFEATGHLLFAKPQSPHAYLADGKKVFDLGGIDAADAIAFIHLLNLPVRDAKKMSAAHEHLLAVIDQSRATWKAANAETDNDNEWLPNPNQQTVVPNMRITREILDSWLAFLDDASAVLEGKRLIPFWRTDDGRGVNLKRVFTEPKQFDLVLWVQGSAATPYLEQGDLANSTTLRRLERVLQGNLLSFFVWVN